jgi:hypothetical protein
MDATERYQRGEAAHGWTQEQRAREIVVAVELKPTRSFFTSIWTT